MYRNTAGQKIAVYAYNKSTGAPVTGDAANLTLHVSKDHGAATILADTSPTELDATKAPGVYLFDTAIGETDAYCLHFTGFSSTTDVYIVPLINIYTLPKTYRSIGRGTVTSGSSTTSITTSAMAPVGAVADQFKSRVITFDDDTTTTALRGQSTDITASTNAAAPTFTVTALTTAPVSGDTFQVT